MTTKKNLPLAIASYIIAVGLLFGSTAFVEISWFAVNPGRENVLMAVSLLLIVSGGYYFYRILTGGLKKRGESIIEVRKKAIAKINNEAYLAKIAREESVPEIRDIAVKKLEQIKQ